MRLYIVKCANIDALFRFLSCLEDNLVCHWLEKIKPIEEGFHLFVRANDEVGIIEALGKHPHYQIMSSLMVLELLADLDQTVGKLTQKMTV